MRFNRIEAKLNAKMSMGRANPSYLWVMAVYLVLTTGLSQLVETLVGVPWSDAMLYLQQGYEIEEVINYVFVSQLGRVGIAAVAEILLRLFALVMDFGLVSYTLRLARNEAPGVNNLFDGFAHFGRVLWLNILTTIFSALWLAIFAVPAIVLLALAMLGYPVVLWAGYFLLIFGAVLMGLWVTYRYYLAFYYVLDDPSCTARQAIRRSKQTMKGHKLEGFALDFSFFGWILLAAVIQEGCAIFGLGLLGVIAAGVLELWLTPYLLTTRANFYRFTSECSDNAARPGGGYAAPDYNYQAPTDPEPF